MVSPLSNNHYSARESQSEAAEIQPDFVRRILCFAVVAALVWQTPVVGAARAAMVTTEAALEMLAGHPPFQGESMVNLIYEHCHTAPVHVTVRETLPPPRSVNTAWT